jgi:putative N-acetylmannosamine-6-phosphate epimerase
VLIAHAPPLTVQQKGAKPARIAPKSVVWVVQPSGSPLKQAFVVSLMVLAARRGSAAAYRVRSRNQTSWFRTPFLLSKA